MYKRERLVRKAVDNRSNFSIQEKEQLRNQSKRPSNHFRGLGKEMNK